MNDPPRLRIDSGNRRGLRATVQGRVVGTGYRAYCVRHARLLGIRGSVRRTGAETIEVVAEGDGAALEGFVAALRRGNRASTVIGMSVEWMEASDGADDFVVTE